MVLDLPDVVDADPLGQLDLLESVLQELVIGTYTRPRTRVLVLVEDPEAHGRSLTLSLDSAGCAGFS
jgi:hypothetical protein